MHRERFESTTGTTLELMPGSSIFADDLDDVYTKVFHTVIQNQLHRLVRALDLHDNGEGWAVIRQHVMRYVPLAPTKEIWSGPLAD